MNTANAYAAYEENNVRTASNARLLIMLYDGAIKFCRFAEISIDEKNVEKRNYYLIKVQDILKELTLTLNEDAGEISNQLASLYDFMINETILANIHNDKAKVAMVKQMMEELRNTWSDIIQ